MPNNPKPARIPGLLADLDHWVGRLTPGSYGSDDLLFWLVALLPREVWEQCLATAERKARAPTYEDLSVLFLELALEKQSAQHVNAYRPGGGGSGSHGRGYQGPGPGPGNTPKNARFMSNVQDLFWCDARDEQGCLLHAPDCDQRNCRVVQGKKEETNTGSKAKMPDHNRCTITCAFCGKRQHYEDECYHKQRLSAKLETENGSGKGSGKGTADQASGKGKSKGRGKGQEKGKGVRGGYEGKPDKDKNSPEGTPSLHQGGTLSTVVGSGTQGLRPVPRHKPNKNKGLSVPTKMGTSQTPANVPASCSWRGNCRRRGLKLPAPPSSDRDAPGDLQIWCSGNVSVLGDENTWGYWILESLYLLWPSKFYLVGN